MKDTEVTMVRIYLHEGKGGVSEIVEYLHDECRVRGVTVFRGISGFGSSGAYHTSSLMDLTLDLPVVIEFYEAPERAEEIVEYLGQRLKADHIVHWRANLGKKGN